MPMLTRTKKAAMQCNTSDKSSSRKDILAIKNFVRKSSNPLKITRKCRGCGENCLTMLEVYEHTSRCIPKAVLCPVKGCPFASIHKQHLKYHLNGHNGKKEFKCSICRYKCLTSNMLKSHLRTHGTIIRFRCNDCNVTTKHPTRLNKHLSESGHTAAPVLDEDGSLPDDENDREFKNYIKTRKRTHDEDDEYFKIKIAKPSNDEEDISNSTEPLKTESQNNTENTFSDDISNKPIEVITENLEDIVKIEIMDTIPDVISYNSVSNQLADDRNYTKFNLTENNDYHNNEDSENIISSYKSISNQSVDHGEFNLTDKSNNHNNDDSENIPEITQTEKPKKTTYVSYLYIVLKNPNAKTTSIN